MAEECRAAAQPALARDAGVLFDVLGDKELLRALLTQPEHSALLATLYTQLERAVRYLQRHHG